MEETGVAQGKTRSSRVYTPEHLGGTSKEAASKLPIIKTGPDDLWRKKAVKEKALADHLAENPVCGEYEPLKMYFPDEEVLGEWATKNTKILPYLHYVQELMKRFTKIEFKHVLRIQNEFDNALDTLSSMIQHPDKGFIDPILVGIQSQSAYYAHVEEETDGKPCGGILYKRTLDLGLLRCVDAKEAYKLLETIPAGTCGPLMNGFILAEKILRAGYFWMTIEIDYIRYIQKCHQWQVHVDMIRVPPNELNATSAPWCFSAWGMDVIGPIEPATSNGYRFILVAINYFTKWVKAVSYKVVTKKVVADFVRDCIVCRFGVPESIITDKSANPNSDLMRYICETIKIKHENSTVYRPQMNGAMEATNKEHQEDIKEYGR
uniref:Uncharacterized protein LOC104237489 n=1 Tax=Nicotiana sylvestris TaxID=4096 RepID=A0A1U7XK06_NICSY|nr:PREDICTED: uncharacterized protein LOC104237489 [Nicotiana sylvestris]